MSQVELARAFRAGELSATGYVSDIEAHFISREPSVQAFIPEAGRFDRLGKEAEALVKQYPRPENRPALFGVLVGVKDIFHAEGFTTRAGSCLPAEELQGVEAETVTRLKGAGALILGKTVTTEFAYFSPGPTRNPHNPEHTPGGSKQRFRCSGCGRPVRPGPWHTDDWLDHSPCLFLRCGGLQTHLWSYLTRRRDPAFALAGSCGFLYSICERSDQRRACPL